MNGSKLAIGIFGTWAIFVGVPWLLYLSGVIHPLWILAGCLAALFISILMIAPSVIGNMTRNRTHRQERITASREWASSLDPEAAIGRVADFFGAKSRVSMPEKSSAEIHFGSDSSFRFWGVYSQRGRKNFPIHLNIRATPGESGSSITVQARDDLGWYAVLVPRALEIGRAAIEEKIDMAETATSDQTGHPKASNQD